GRCRRRAFRSGRAPAKRRAAARTCPLPSSRAYDAEVPESVVLLHGFSGTHRAWDGVNAHLDGERYLPLALDLPGHGEASAEPHPITFPGCVAYVLARAPARFTLCGYSMGGRVALHVALAAPQQITRLVLIACRPGIEDEHERAQRRRADEALARELETGPFEQFVQRWRS